MWGNRRNVTYYSCRPASHRSRNIPEDHPRYVYLNEDRLSEALLGFLADAVFGPHRHAYWQRCLDEEGGPDRAAPASERLKELAAEVAELERRLTRQLINLEADDLTPSLRRRINERVSELEAATGERNRRRSSCPAGRHRDPGHRRRHPPAGSAPRSGRQAARHAADGAAGPLRPAAARGRLPPGRERSGRLDHAVRRGGVLVAWGGIVRGLFGAPDPTPFRTLSFWW